MIAWSMFEAHLLFLSFVVHCGAHHSHSLSLSLDKINCFRVHLTWPWLAAASLAYNILGQVLK